MQEQNAEQRIPTRLEDINAAVSEGTLSVVQPMIGTLNPAELGHLLESLPRSKRYFIWQFIDPDLQGETLAHVNEEVRANLIDVMENDELLAAAIVMDMDDLADVFGDLPEVVTQELLTSMDIQDRQRLESILSYPEDSAGGMMNIDIVTVRGDVTIDVVLRYLRIRGDLPELTDNLSVVDRNDNLLGTLPLTTILTSDVDLFVKDVMSSGSQALLADTPAEEVAQYFEQQDLVSVPVVDKTNHLLGRITIDDVVDVIRDEADQDLMRMAGLDEEDDIFAPIIPSASKRAIWLGINLLTALLASWVIGLFEATIDQIVALAVLMPIVASMGGIAGSQTLTLVIRSIALGQLGQSNTRWLMLKEISVGTLNGLLWALVVASVAYAWFGSKSIGMIIAAAMVINLAVATTAGVAIPIMLKRIGIDPALAGSVLLTTVTDVIGFMAFLGLATWWLI
ncbi:MAG TPA: magnesium transporter [Gammaproteobacteria bacterium]|jgi:magnesium transporter